MFTFRFECPPILEINERFILGRGSRGDLCENVPPFWQNISADHFMETVSVWNECSCRSSLALFDSMMIEASQPWESKCKLTRDESLVAEYNAELCSECLIILSVDVWKGQICLRWEDRNCTHQHHLVLWKKLLALLTTAFPPNVHFYLE